MKSARKIISLLLATVMLSSTAISATAVNNAEQKGKASAFSASYVDENGERFSNIDYSSDLAYKNSRAVLPSAYNSAEHGYVTSVKNQGYTGTCWAHAALASCESNLIMQHGYDKSIDLAELHLAYAMYHTQTDKLGMFDSTLDFFDDKVYLDEGGFAADALITLANQQGIIRETANHGQFDSSKMHLANSKNFYVYNPEAMYAFNEVFVTNGYKIPYTNRDMVKQYIIDYGCGTMDYCSDPEFYNAETSAYYCYDLDRGVDHCVALVGWDDNYPRENFNPDNFLPENDGAWLFKNSWGEEEGIDGYMWISYEDKSLNRFPALFYEVEKSDKYTNTYQYDDLYKESLYEDENGNKIFVGGAYMSNVFTAVDDNETLEAVSFYTSNDMLDYTIDIYTGVEGVESPTNGTLKATVTGEDLTMGYHSVELPEPVALTKGEKFSVVVNIKDNQNKYRGAYVNIDYGFTSLATKVSDYGESFFSLDGENWQDLKYSFDGNMRIKAFTNSNAEPIEVTDYYDSYAGKTREEHIASLKETLDKCKVAIYKDYTYSEYSLTNLMDVYFYANDAYNAPEKFLALEFNALKNRLEQLYDMLEPYNIEDDIMDYYFRIMDNVMFFNEISQWDEFLAVYNNVVEESKNVELTYDKIQDYITQVEQAYVDYMAYAIDHGSNRSYLQNFGDIDNGGDINISDATSIQMLVAGFGEYSFYEYYNYDVDGDDSLTIKDATLIQMYVAKLIDYFPVYNTQFGYADEFGNLPAPKVEDVDMETAISNLENTVKDLESQYYFDVLEYMIMDDSYHVLWRQYLDAKEVLENPGNYHENVIDFKARCLDWNMSISQAAG